MESTKNIPIDYVAGYKSACNVDSELAERYVAHTMIGDPVADDMTEYMSTLSRQESAAMLGQALEGNEVDDLLRRHPKMSDFVESLNVIPDWVDTDSFYPGYRMFHRNVRMVLVGMLGGVLIEGFASNISKSFFITGRLRESGVRRLRQNNRHMVEIFIPGGLERGSDGWLLSARIRVVHAKVRSLLSGSFDWDAKSLGTPISSAHLGFAIASFSARLIQHMESLGASFTDDERASFMQVWRYSGYLMGIPESILFKDEAEALRMFEIGRLCEPEMDLESIIMANSLIKAAGRVVGISDQEEARKLTTYAYKVSRSLIGDELADQLNYPSSSTFGVLPGFRMQARFSRLIARVWPRHATQSRFAQFTGLFDASQYDEHGISYRLPDHHYAEESDQY